MTSVLIKRENLEIHMHMERMPCEDEFIIDCFHKPRNTKDCQKTTRQEAWNKFSVIALRSNQPYKDLDFRLLTSRTVRQ